MQRYLTLCDKKILNSNSIILIIDSLKNILVKSLGVYLSAEL
jgi:hypothetical protein